MPIIRLTHELFARLRQASWPFRTVAVKVPAAQFAELHLFVLAVPAEQGEVVQSRLLGFVIEAEDAIALRPRSLVFACDSAIIPPWAVPDGGELVAEFVP